MQSKKRKYINTDTPRHNCITLLQPSGLTNLAGINNYYLKVKVKEKCSHYRPGVAQRVGRGIALLFHDRGTRRL